MEQKQKEKLDTKIQKIIKATEEFDCFFDSKDFVLCLLFYRIISENVSRFWRDKNANQGAKYEDMSDDDEAAKSCMRATWDTIGYYIKPSHLFPRVLREAYSETNLSETLLNIFTSIEKQSVHMEFFQKPLTSMYFWSDRSSLSVCQKNKSILSIMHAISSLDFSELKEAYSNFVCRYISSGSDFCVPLEVSELLLELAKDSHKKEEHSEYTVKAESIDIYCNKYKFETVGVGFDVSADPDIMAGVEVATFSEGPDCILEQTETKFGLFSTHFSACSEKQSSAILMIYDRLLMDAWKELIKHLIDGNALDAVISLPNNFLEDKNISAYVLVLKKRKSKNKQGVLFIDSSKVLSKEGQEVELKETGVQQILDYYKKRNNIDGCSFLAGYEEIKNKNYSISVVEYISKS